MSNGNSTTVNINLFIRNTYLIDAIYSLTRKGFVDLKEINILLAQSGRLQHFGDSERGANAHDAWRYTDDGCKDEFANDGEVEAFGDGTAGEENGCCSI